VELAESSDEERELVLPAEEAESMVLTCSSVDVAIECVDAVRDL
jgi:hypothetical protein